MASFDPHLWMQVSQNGLFTTGTHRIYRRYAQQFLTWCDSEGTSPVSRTAVTTFAQLLVHTGKSPSTVNLALSAIRHMLHEAANEGLTTHSVAASITAVRGVKNAGIRAGNWLTLSQLETLIITPPDNTIRGIRDRAILATLAGCALRRTELVQLQFEVIQRREGRWVFADLKGKGNRIRTVPMPHWVVFFLFEWAERAGLREGPVFRPVRKNGVIDNRTLTDKVIWQVVDSYAKTCGFGHLTPHDLRRTCAKLCRAAGGDIEQIQYLLGHSSVQTTERYLGSRQRLDQAVNDLIEPFVNKGRTPNASPATVATENK